MLKKQKGITLIALVVTIVVLLILAGVTINLLLDENGIIVKSKDARREYSQAKTNEETDLDSASSWIDEITNEPEIVEPKNIADWNYTEEDDGTITITSYKGTDTTVIIPNSINGKKVKKLSGTTPSLAAGTHKVYFSIWNAEIRNGKEYFAYYKGQDTITKVIISPGIEEIESGNLYDGVFAYSTALEEIIIPDTVVKIGNAAFYGCKNLKKVNIPKKVDTIRENVFTHCTNLESITIPSNVTSIENGAFYNCKNLSNIIIPSSVTSIGNMAFADCKNLSNIIIPSSVTSIGDHAFSGCSNLLNITIPASVTTMGSNVFQGNPILTSVNVSFKEGEQPAGWNENWNVLSDGYTVTVNYAK